MPPITGTMRNLPYPLDVAVSIEAETPPATGTIRMPAFPADADEDITVSMRLSLNKFVALATAIDVGSDPAYGENAILIWWIWATSMVEICEELAACLTEENPAVVEALAQLIRNNPTIASALNDQRVEAGGGSPGEEISEELAQRDMLPENVKPDDECDFNALWGGMLYLVQSGNRSITDFLEALEAASNTLEAMALAANLIPATGNYISSGFEFANAVQEFFAENYAANYTEGYEQQLACALFCVAKTDCTLSIDDMIDVINARFGEPFDVLSFAAIMARIGTGSTPGNFVGEQIVDAMFLLYFTSLKFGQKFGDVIGLRPLPVIISLGADQLASDNWEVLCECPIEEWESMMDLTQTTDYGWASLGAWDSGNAGHWESGVGYVSAHGASAGNGYQIAQAAMAVDLCDVTEIKTYFYVTNGTNGGIPYTVGTDTVELAFSTEVLEDGGHSFEGVGDAPGSTQLYFRVQAGYQVGNTADPGGEALVIGVRIKGTGAKPPQLP